MFFPKLQIPSATEIKFLELPVNSLSSHPKLTRFLTKKARDQRPFKNLLKKVIFYWPVKQRFCLLKQ